MTVKRLTEIQKSKMTDAIAGFGVCRVNAGSIVIDNGKTVLNFVLSQPDISTANLKGMAKKIAEANIFEEVIDEIHSEGVCMWPTI